MPNHETSPLLTPYTLGSLELPNRIAMAPMTRYRGDEDGVPLPIVADYYAQRAGAGLIVSEGIWPSFSGQSGWRIPGLVTEDQVRGWRRVTDAVHAAGGRIAAQLMHAGRNTHPDSRIDGGHPLAPSPVPQPLPVRTRYGKADPLVPAEMTGEDIRTAVADHARAARNAIRAGFDLVELHGANSYLIHQFLADNTNLRTDAYGGSGRTRFAVEAVRAVVAEIGAERTAIRLSPGNSQFGMAEADPAPVYRSLLAELDPLGLAYLHLTEAAGSGYRALADLRPRWSGTLIGNVGENGEATTKGAAEEVLRSGRADLVSFGRAFISNPDLPHRFATGAPVAPPESKEHFYSQGPEGYTDYPAASGALLTAAR
ncbi:alkene reductase [Nocardiopsis composta]|uniref:N-ethylmaleimide reductase n=1 Tax=Nocardiopsis composta TaxID=157465 RepID=A0A7W8QNA3_9ACTN|nr:alkene reductase [Nocardiopsis composta]MBB5433426.1 N-ethylmaleimide reductase [Nocardiopsis composta]